MAYSIGGEARNHFRSRDRCIDVAIFVIVKCECKKEEGNQSWERKREGGDGNDAEGAGKRSRR